MNQMVRPILKQSVKALLEQQDRQGCWSYPAHLGCHYISLYALFLEWLRFRGFSSRLDLNRLAGILLETQLPDGSWRQARDPALPSGDINATVFNVAALDHFYRKHPGRFPSIPGAIQRGLGFVDPLYFDHGKGYYLGCLMDGGVWDTILAAQALAQAGETSDPLVLAAENIYATQTAEGGFPYGRDFEQYPDVDDTSRALVFLEKMAPFTRRTGAVASRKQGLQWLLQRQNSDGGFGESTLSYLDNGQWGRGASTPTQSAWVPEFLL